MANFVELSVVTIVSAEGVVEKDTMPLFISKLFEAFPMVIVPVELPVLIFVGAPLLTFWFIPPEPDEIVVVLPPLVLPMKIALLPAPVPMDMFWSTASSPRLIGAVPVLLIPS